MTAHVEDLTMEIALLLTFVNVTMGGMEKIAAFHSVLDSMILWDAMEKDIALDQILVLATMGTVA